MAKNHSSGKWRKWAGGALAVTVLGGGGVWGARRLSGPAAVEVPLARVERGEFVISVRARGEMRSSRSTVIAAPRSPESRIVRLAEAGKIIKAGEVAVEFDPATQEQVFLERQSEVRRVDSEIVQAQAQHRIVNEQDATLLMQTEYNLERARLEASKQEILSEIQGAKNRIDVSIAEGERAKTKGAMEAHQQVQQAELTRLARRRDRTVGDMDRAKGYLENMALRAPADGMVTILPNSRSGGEGQANPPFKAGDRTFTGAAILEIPDLSHMHVEVRIEEVDRGTLKIGQAAKVRVDAVPDLEMDGTLEWISPIAVVAFRSFPPERNFPARIALAKLDPRLRPGMSATTEIVIDRQDSVLAIPVQASFEMGGQLTVFVREGGRYRRQQIQAGQRNGRELLVLSGLSEGQAVALENPEEAAKKKLGR